MKVISSEVAAHLSVCREATIDSHPMTREMASAKATAHPSAKSAAHMSAAHMTAPTESAAVSTSSTAASKGVGGQPPAESGSG
jgi:hypothetical protein